MARIQELITKRSNWLRAEGETNSWLYREIDGKMCCLGFACVAAGIPVEGLVGKKAPAQAATYHGEKMNEAGLGFLIQHGSYNSDEAQGLMSDNDSIYLLEREREDRITEKFRLHGISVTFVD